MTTDGPRARMVESAALLMRERGVTGTGMRDIAERARAPRGSLQHYFPDGKEQVVTEALAWVADQVTAPLLKVARGEKAVPPRTVVAKSFARWERMLTDTDFLAGCPLVATVTDAAANDGLRDAAGEVFTRWRTALAAALRAGGLSRQRADATALLAISALEGAVVLSRAQRDLAPLRAVARELDRVLAD